MLLGENGFVADCKLMNLSLDTLYVCKTMYRVFIIKPNGMFMGHKLYNGV